MSGLKMCEQRRSLLGTAGHILVLGGPGSGKTTIALVKASTEIGSNVLAPGQKVLFLSFARATVARIMQEAKVRVPHAAQASLEINTYHGFAWAFIQAHGYLLTGHRILHLLPPPEAAGQLAGVAKADRAATLRGLLRDNGMLGFDLFAGLAADLLEQSPRLCRLLADCYPIIILDEFQDTNSDEWRMIRALGQHSRLISLADPEQRIYEFRGADPARIREFMSAFHPTVFDFGRENNRSDGTDITLFGNDLLTGANIGKTYTHVQVVPYPFYRGDSLSPMKYEVLRARQRLLRGDKSDWSIAVLVKSKDMMLKVSSCLGASSERLPEISHDVLIDPEGPALSAVLLGGLMQGGATVEEVERSLLVDVIAHIRGRGGMDITQTDLELSNALIAHQAGQGLRGRTRLALMADIRRIAEARIAFVPTGDPEADWLAVRRMLDGANHEKLKSISNDARFIRLLNRGTQLRESLAEHWRITGGYKRARDIVAGALLQEHFSSSTRAWTGVNVMTIHKSKGKEFDEVIIFEGSHAGRLLRQNATPNDIEQARLALRVGVTRARARTTLLTPNWKKCPLLCS